MNVNNILTNFWGSIKTYLSGNYQPKGSYANSSHTHDDRYYTETEVNTKLSGKSDTSHNHDSTYVKLTGDQSISGSKTFNNNITLNGSLNLQNSVDNVCLRVQGGSGENKGSRLILSGKDRSGLNGAFELLATDGTSHSLLKGLPSGSLTWQDKNIALDDNVVHKTGNEGISGVKIFHNVVVGEQDGLIRIGGNLEGGHYCTLNYDGLFYGNQKQFVPKTNNEYNLGTSSNKWADVNTVLLNGKTPAYDSDVVHKSDQETISGRKIFLNVTESKSHLEYCDTQYDWSDTSLNTWCSAGHVAWLDKNGKRRMHELVGTANGIWTKNCFINEKEYFCIDSNRNFYLSGNAITFNGKSVECVDSIGTNYIRYISGVQICWALVQISGASYKDANFAKTFISEPLVTLGVFGGGNSFPHLVSVNSQGCRIDCGFNIPSESTFGVTYTAIGKWK